MEKIISKFFCFLLIYLTISCSNDNENGQEIDLDLTNGLILQALLDGNALDTSGNMNNGEIIGSVNIIVNRNNESNAALNFNEDEGHIDFGNIPELEINYDSTISISVWIKPNGGQVSWDTILNQFFEGPPPSALGRFYLGLNPNNQRVRWNILGNQLESSNQIPIDEWTHLVVTYNNRKAVMFVNGILDGELNFGQETLGFGSGAPFKIGKQSLTPTSGSGFSGSIDDINIFDRLLSDVEIQALFNN
ncbi:LamG domain-containing protein [Flagellimonas sp.]|uniref:LamG domain-containing protein n=1 Tax=Flagellimonas sp. TaxID=2058762 RepID=UPI000B6660E4|nr:MAG: LamG domain-containing protein [Muricauda sp. TMED12]|tara:strand:+ start:392 stop:1135 length:744 start_codon:yes stop_codon:yes gene_type:complete